MGRFLFIYFQELLKFDEPRTTIKGKHEPRPKNQEPRLKGTTNHEPRPKNQEP